MLPVIAEVPQGVGDVCDVVDFCRGFQYNSESHVLDIEFSFDPGEFEGKIANILKKPQKTVNLKRKKLMAC